ncbi:MAG: hypothetical protein HQL94_04990 [Magnetococcales bacterium]|nr:hypothetical protein [Magnetococcales bacterium]MBF0438743.1 hypothetical protein [Magnetococcales bacterium]
MNQPNSNKNGFKYSVSMDFETVSLPPFKDILILAKKCPVGISGISKCMGLMTPDGFEMVEVDDAVVEAILINKQITKRLPLPEILALLRTKVFPFISHGEIVKINFHVKIFFERIEGGLESQDGN